MKSLPFNLAIWFTAFGMVAVAASGRTADGQPDPKELLLCDSAKGVPSVKQLRQQASLTNDKRAEALRKVDAFGQVCNQVKKSQNFSQIRTTGDFTSKKADAQKALTEYNTEVKKLKQLAGPIASGMAELGDPACKESIDSGVQMVGDEDNISKRITAACDLGGSVADRKQQAAEAISNKDRGSAEEIKAALENPRDNAAKSAQLLKEAHDYAISHGLPDPQKGANDQICGEACVAVLRLKDTPPGEGETPSYEWTAARNVVLNTNAGVYNRRYGRVFN